MNTTSSAPLLAVEALRVSFRRAGRLFPVVEEISFKIESGHMMALVGESGCGKSLTAAALLGLLPWGFVVDQGRILLDGQEVLGLSHSDLRRLRRRLIGAIFQNPLAALNPSLPIWKQVVEAAQLSFGLGRRAARNRALELLELVGVPDAGHRLDDYPHQFSGGMRQRVAIALALSCNPRLLVADEPTTALDLITQSEILALLNGLRREHGLAILFITHDLSLVAEYADQVLVMYAGRMAEFGEVRTVLDRPLHPYTQALLGAIPKLASPETRLTDIDGLPPSLFDYPRACRFAPRCIRAIDRCRNEEPPWVGDDEHRACCHRPLGLGTA